MQIEPYDAARHLAAIIELSLRAWEPVFASMQRVLPAAIYDTFYPEGYLAQREAVAGVCNAEDSHVWVALEGDAPVGFVAVKLHQADLMGEITMVAVDPAAQGKGIGQALTNFAANWMREAGMSIAMVETGGDPGHGPARHTYEQAGFSLMPIARYFKKL